jgi:hypothetical protein
MLNRLFLSFDHLDVKCVRMCLKPVCYAMYKEVALMIDSSDKPTGVFNAMLGFAQSIAYNFAYLGQNLVRLAAVTYSNAPTVQFNLGWNMVWYDWANNPLNNIAYTGGGSNLSAALNLLRTSVFSETFARPGVPKVAIVITDNLPTLADSDNLLAAVAKVRDSDIRLVVVGIVANDRRKEELWNNTDGEFVSFVRDYNQLSNVLLEVMRSSCVTSYSNAASGKCDQ